MQIKSIRLFKKGLDFDVNFWFERFDEFEELTADTGGGFFSSIEVRIFPALNGDKLI